MFLLLVKYVLFFLYLVKEKYKRVVWGHAACFFVFFFLISTLLLSSFVMLEVTSLCLSFSSYKIIILIVNFISILIRIK